MTAAQVDILGLVRDYAAAIEKAIYCQPGSEEEAHWITAGAKVYAKLANITQSYQRVVEAAQELEAYRYKRSTDSYLDFCLRSRLAALCHNPEIAAPDQTDQSLIDTQPVDTSAILAALERDPNRPRWGGL